MGPRNHVLDGVQFTKERGTFEGGHAPAHCNMPMCGIFACPAYAKDRCIHYTSFCRVCVGV